MALSAGAPRHRQQPTPNRDTGNAVRDTEMNYAPWIKRLVAQWLDMAVAAPFLLLFLVAREVTSGTTLIVIGLILLSGYSVTTFQNRCIMMGRTGWSWGKMLMGIRIVDSRTGRPTGVKRMIIREFAHTVDMLTGFGMMLPLFPKWDRKGQLFADKIMKTVVIDQPWNRAERTEPARAETPPAPAYAVPIMAHPNGSALTNTSVPA
jgi:uncharacterized RDD family membrane protein YckC